MVEVRSFGLLLTAWISLSASVAANAQFFFLFPIPRGPSDPDKVEATSDQRQFAMCAAYNANVLDPNLSGNRNTSWRGDVIRAAKTSMKDYQKFDDLMNRYIRQWRLQMKSSYEAGLSYSKTLTKGCISSGLPYSVEQVSAWKSSSSPSTLSVAKLSDRDPVPSVPLSVVENIQFSENAINSKSILLEAEITKEGKVKSCRSFVDGANRAIETQSCQILSRQQFNPRIESSFPTAGFYQIYASSYTPPAAAANQVVKTNNITSAPKITNQNTGDDPVLDKAMIRCKAMGYKQGSAQFGSCVERQIGRLEPNIR